MCETAAAVDSLVSAKPEPFSKKGESLPFGVIATYCLPTVGCGFMFLLFALYLMPFATDVLGISPAIMGTIFGLSRIWDALSDPLAGYWSDRTRSRLGRRRPWIFVSILPISAAYLMVWSPPSSLSGDALLAWMTIGVFGFYSAMTVFVVPHMSLGAELTPDYHDRSRIFGMRHAGWMLGSVTALVGMYLLILAKDESAQAVREVAAELAVFVAIVTALMLAFTAFRLKERPDFQDRGARKPYGAFVDVLKNPHARLLIFVNFVENLGAAIISVLALYISRYVVGAPELAPFLILSYMVPSIASVPLWISVSRRVGKKNLWLGSMILTAFCFGSMIFFGEGDILGICALSALAGFSAGAGGTVAPSIQADVIDFDEYQTGERKEGVYFATWNLVYKSSTGITVMLAGFVLQASGFVPNVEQTDEVKWALRSLFAVFPFVCYLIGAAIFSRFSLGEEEHVAIRAELDHRAANRGEAS